MGGMSANTDGIRLLAQALKDAVPDVAKELRQKVRDAGATIGHQAERNASWSHKIPRTIRWTASGTKVTVRAGYKSVPTARWFELGHSDSSTNKWNHPKGLPGIGFDAKLPRSKWPWTAMRAPYRPYLHPALEETKDVVTKDILLALVDTLQEIVDEAGEA